MKKLTALSVALLLAAAPAGMLAQNHRGQGNGSHRGQQTTTARPGSSMQSPGGNSISRPSGSSATRPGGSHNNSGDIRPGGNHNSGGVRPGSNHNSGSVRPGGNHNSGGNNYHPGGMRPGHSAPRPGVGATPSPRPRPGYGYRPPRIHRWERPLPPPPVRVSYRPVYAVPTIPGVLGLTFGTFIDYGINSLINAGYTIAGAIDNAIYLNNVNQFGIIWPQATIYYGNRGMSSARFQLGSYSPNRSQFDNVYNSLCAAYGAPVSTDFVDGRNVCTWWGGNNTGYITLQYGPGLMQNGGSQYYTDLIIGNGY